MTGVEVMEEEFTFTNFKNWFITNDDGWDALSLDLFDDLKKSEILSENFFKWPLDRQREIIYAADFAEIDPTDLATFFEVRRRLQEERSELGITWETSMDDCYNICCREFTSSGLGHSAFSQAFLEFKSIIGMFTRAMRITPEMTATMLSVIYSEDLVTQALTKIATETKSSSLTELYFLIQNWSEWRDYPMVWIQNVVQDTRP